MTPAVDTVRSRPVPRAYDGLAGVRLRVLFIDGSVVLRRALKELFRKDEAMEVWTAAPAIDVMLLNVAKARPHLAVIDADQEWKNVQSLIEAMRSGHPDVPLVLSTAQEAARQSLYEKGKGMGIKDCWFKRNGLANPDAGLREHLLQQAEAALGIVRRSNRSANGDLNGSSPMTSRPETKGANAGTSLQSAPLPGKKSLVVIGVSTGGPEALSVLMPMLPADLKVPVLIVQHTLAAFTTLLVERLQKRTSLTVLEAQDEMPVTAGQVVVAPGNRHMQIAVRNGQMMTILDDGPPENSCRPAVDPLFRSAARVLGSHVVGVILTGMGQDGLAGCRDLKRAGGTILAQDQASSTVWGMPGQVTQAGLADKVLSLKDIADEIIRRVGVLPKAKFL